MAREETNAQPHDLTGPEKAAIFLLTMGEEFTTDVFKELEDIEIKSLGKAMTNISNVSPGQIQDVLWEFLQSMEEPGEIRVKGDDFFKNTIGRALDGSRADGLIQDVNSPVPFSNIKNIDAKALGNFIRNEHPQTIALVLAHIDPGKSAQIISEFPEPLQQDVMLRIADLDSVPISVLDEVEQVLREEIKAQGPVGGRPAGGSSTVAEILNQVDQNTENAILTKLEEERSDLANEVRKLMFVFEDLINVDDRSIRTILKEVNNDELTMAMKSASPAMQEKIFSNLSERAADMIREDLEAMGPTRLADVEKSQQAILRAAKKLEAEGKIVIGKGDGGDQFV
ncbi:MAG: flagellar motor switch protein FliG [Deltaproteobacteria bacterium]|jgi:flagellar motor switch protein FliG|nr:flagellar motor switch protein FliG [Deltaproteobacteria bacterium]MDR1309742.1 flagellar motor switch protein FliG [Deltaproteobacteria bacterium]